MNIGDWKIGTKLNAAFLIISTVLLIVGGLGYQNIQSMGDSTENILQTVPLKEAAMKMKLSVAQDMQMIMELLVSENDEALQNAWQ